MGSSTATFEIKRVTVNRISSRAGGWLLWTVVLSSEYGGVAEGYGESFHWAVEDAALKYMDRQPR